MTAPARRKDAATSLVELRSITLHDLWEEAAQIRQDWLGVGLCTQPADRGAAEQCLTEIYARISRPRPRFDWVDSPAKALPLIAELPTLEQLSAWIRQPIPPGVPPLASDLAMLAARLRGALSAGVRHPDPELSAARRGKLREPWPLLPPERAFETGVPLGVVLHQGVRASLYRSLGRGFYLPIRAGLADGEPLPVCWYGQQDAAWIAYYDVLERLGLAQYPMEQMEHLSTWSRLARSCGWWWPGDDVCVVVERPQEIVAEQVKGAFHGEVRALRATYRDGWRPLPA